MMACLCMLIVHVVHAGAFKFETKLEVLKLGWCKVGGGEGAKAMADLLMYNKTLRQVSGKQSSLEPHWLGWCGAAAWTSKHGFHLPPSPIRTYRNTWCPPFPFSCAA